MSPLLDAAPVATQSVRAVRAPYLVDPVVFVGGHPGCGKTMLAPIITSLARVELQKFNYTMEHICCLQLLGRIEPDAAATMIRMLLDLDLYNLQMARETNLRPSDTSSIFQNPGGLRYLSRLLGAGDAAAVARIRRERPILEIVTHNLLAISGPLFAALGERMRIVEVVRHPLYMIKQWFVYIDRYGTDVRDFTIWFDYQGRALPFFARGWEERYVQSRPMDRVIYAIEHLTRIGERTIAELPAALQSLILLVPFEAFVLDPFPWMATLEQLLGTTSTPLTRKELKKQKVPRTRIADGRSLPIYKQYGWEPPKAGTDERGELTRRREFAKQHATPEAMAVLDRMCEAYEARYGIEPPDRSAG